jgi:hypothetical protein
MAFAPSRLRRGEIIAGLSAIALLILLFVIPWFRFAAHIDASGWRSLPTLRWLIAAVALMGVLLAFFQASRDAPALPVAWSVIVTTLAAVMTVLVIIRLPTDGGRPLLGAYLGLVASAALTVGAFISLRQEDGWVPDRDHPIETIAIGPPTHS